MHTQAAHIDLLHINLVIGVLGIGGDRTQISELEKRLLTNDSEDLNLDSLIPAYPPT